MSVLFDAPVWILAMVVVLMVVATNAARRLRSMDRRLDVKVCGNCGATQPSHATFCRQCGKHV